MERNDSFGQTLTKLESKFKKMDMAMQNTCYSYSIGNMELAYDISLRLEDVMEKALLLARSLPAYTGNPMAKQETEDIIAINIPVEIGFTAEGWFSVRIPLLLPKKANGSASYIRSFLYPAMEEFFFNKPPVRFSDCVLIYRHVYDKQRPERQRRDHDNIEINMVSDTVALYVMKDDSPSLCRHYYCSAAGTTERTEVYVVPVQGFVLWLDIESSMPDEGVKLYENRRESTEKDM